MNDEDYYNEKINYYIEIGAIRVVGVDPNGEYIFELNEDITKALAPELWESHMEYVDESLIELYQEGLIDVEYDENLDATIILSTEGFQIAKEKGLLPIRPEGLYGDESKF
jgi:LEA14-like dessication related protein